MFIDIVVCSFISRSMCYKSNVYCSIAARRPNEVKYIIIIITNTSLMLHMTERFFDFKTRSNK